MKKTVQNVPKMPIESKRLVQNKQARNKKENIQKILKDKK